MVDSIVSEPTWMSLSPVESLLGFSIGGLQSTDDGRHGAAAN